MILVKHVADFIKFIKLNRSQDFLSLSSSRLVTFMSILEFYLHSLPYLLHLIYLKIQLFDVIRCQSVKSFIELFVGIFLIVEIFRFHWYEIRNDISYASCISLQKLPPCSLTGEQLEIGDVVFCWFLFCYGGCGNIASCTHTQSL